MNFKGLKVLAIPLALMAGMAMAKDGFEYYGSWSNVEVSESEDPHALGYQLTLWKYKGKTLGFLFEFVGPVADPPIGAIENLILDEKTGKLSFTTKMSLGAVYAKDEKKWVPSKDRYSFRGIVKDSTITGTFSWQNQEHQNKKPVVEAVVLKSEKGKDLFWNDKTYEEWKEFYAPVIKSRGPKW